MKLSLALAALILLGGAGFSWRNHARLAGAREEQRQLARAAADRGMSGSADDSAWRQSGRREREARQPRPEATQVAAEVIAFFREMRAMDTEEQERLEDPLQGRLIELSDMVAAMPSGQLPALLAEIRAAGLDEDARREILVVVLAGASHKDPRAAFEVAFTLPEFTGAKFTRNPYLATLLHAWAVKDPHAAARWYLGRRGQEPEMDGATARRVLLQAASASDPVLALDLIGKLEITDIPEAVGKVMRGSGPTPAARSAALAALRGHVAAIPDEKERVAATRAGISALSGLAVSDGLELGSRWLETAGLSGEELARTVRETLPGNVAGAETGGWLEWIGRTLPPESSPEVVRGLMSRWATDDFRASGTWLNSLPAGPLKLASTRAYAQAVAVYEPETATEWAITLPEGPARDETLETIRIFWAKKDPAAAADFAARHGIGK